MADKIAGVLDFLISIIGISAGLYMINQKSKTQPDFEFLGLKIPTVKKIGFFGILIFIALIIVKLTS